ncbi:BgTH12-07674 [Blumeria graminis f. sp. triticale]|uniref:BgtAc-30857 n=2 Tax=Blumeria graminis TaxID=34373 RepID=A0A9X9LAE0_BLUGR|nr:BgTH12-07674 [Blumeria graminis f. sp. triticale]VCU40759.1 BgtAc-30857 [Blumeria graminis f. sp. tritici]
MKFLHLTGIIVLLSQATSISAALLVPRSGSQYSASFEKPMDEIRKEIARIQRENIELKSPNNSIKSLATRLRYPFLIPISVGYEFNQKGHGNYVTNDGNRNLNYWVVVDSDGKEVCSSNVN